MKLDEQFKQLQHHPKNEQLQQQMYDNITESKTKTSWHILSSRVGEMSFVLLFIALASFLVFTSLHGTEQAASGAVKAVYSYKSDDVDEAFRAKPSTNYIGMENITTSSFVTLFENIDELPTVTPRAKEYGDYEIIVVYENGQQRRFELEATYLYDVDADLYYPGYGEMPVALYEDLYAAHHTNKLPVILLPILIMMVTIAISLFYQRRKWEQPKQTRATYVAMMIYGAIMMAIFYYVSNVGLLYFPFMLVLILGIAYLMWWPIQRVVTNPIMLRVEKLKILALALIIIVFLIWR